jgi:hypothetical protein
VCVCVCMISNTRVLWVCLRDDLADHLYQGGDMACGFGSLTIQAQSINKEGLPYMDFPPPEGQEDEYPDLLERLDGAETVCAQRE